MKPRAVNWAEGMVLAPQHMQAAERWSARRIGEAVEWSSPFVHGAWRLELVVAGDQVRVASCAVRFGDGGTLSVPEDLPADTLAARLPRTARVVVYLTETQAAGRRPAEWSEVEDDNGEGGVIEVEFRRPAFELAVAAGDQGVPAGPRVLPLARIVLGTGPGARPELDAGYIPPLLAIDAWPPLTQRLRALADRAAALADRMLESVAGRPLALEGRGGTESVRPLKLAALLAVLAPLEALCTTPRLHPWPVFLELCRAAGQLAPFRGQPARPTIPPYDHDDLGGSFEAVVREIEAGLLDEKPPPYDVYPFRRPPAAPRKPLEVKLKSAWLRERRRLYLAVRTSLDSDECLSILRKADLTIAGRDDVETLHQRKLHGLDPRPLAEPDVDLPTIADLRFFEFDDVDQVWGDAFDSGALAIQVNPKRFEPRGDDEITTIVDDEPRASMRFFLYVFHD